MAFELAQLPTDDPAFAELVTRLVRGAVNQAKPTVVYSFRIDNWFDHKWLGFSGANEANRRGFSPSNVRIPPFVPNRVVSETRTELASAPRRSSAPRPLHRKQRGSHGTRLDALEPGSALFWSSGASRANQRGSLMAYLPAGASYWCWYSAFSGPEWGPTKLVQITGADLADLDALAV